jgi:hypothetical protein
MTGLRADGVPAGASLRIAGQSLNRVRTFSDVPLGAPFWYENANGMVEVAVNSGRASEVLGIGIGTPVALVA